MIVPLADNLNHEDVCVDHVTLDHDFLESKSKSFSLINDYRDFTGMSYEASNPMKIKTHKNRLEKYLAWFGIEKIDEINAIWEIDQILTSVGTSTDEEDQVHQWTSEESSESTGQDFDLHFDCAGKYFVMKTKENGSFRAGDQVYNCYGRLNNFDMLLDYGFCLYPNKFDSYHLRILNSSLYCSVERNPKVKTFNLKYQQLNLALLERLRKKMSAKSKYKTLVSASIEEIQVIGNLVGIINQAYRLYPTLLEYDLSLINDPQPQRRLYAISDLYLEYRVSQKKILLSQLEILQNLLQVLQKVSLGFSVRAAHWEQRDIETLNTVYPLRTYLYNLEYSELW
jgi:hypothetical protein